MQRNQKDKNVEVMLFFPPSVYADGQENYSSNYRLPLGQRQNGLGGIRQRESLQVAADLLDPALDKVRAPFLCLSFPGSWKRWFASWSYRKMDEIMLQNHPKLVGKRCCENTKEDYYYWTVNHLPANRKGWWKSRAGASGVACLKEQSGKGGNAFFFFQGQKGKVVIQADWKYENQCESGALSFTLRTGEQITVSVNLIFPICKMEIITYRLTMGLLWVGIET